MIGWLKGVLSTPKIATDVVEGAISGIDKLFFTEEEKSDARQKMSEVWLDTVKATAGESSIRSITRRILAVMIVGTFLFFLITSFLCFPYLPTWSAFGLSLAKELSTLTLAVGVFYFGTYAIGTYLMGGKKKGD